MSDRPLIYVDLIKDEPLPRDDWYEHEGGVNKDGNFWPDDAAMELDYKAYRIGFQSWRLVIRSGDNYRVLFRSSERYHNEADARHAAELAFGSNSDVYLREKDMGNVALRLASDGG